ncbi:MAG: hypothetical protein LC775_05120 [Acidobacteria bacterium]|nr:hypothetical protein [Acidobacteriota bacterium]
MAWILLSGQVGPRCGLPTLISPPAGGPGCGFCGGVVEMWIPLARYGYVLSRSNTQSDLAVVLAGERRAAPDAELEPSPATQYDGCSRSPNLLNRRVPPSQTYRHLRTRVAPLLAESGLTCALRYHLGQLDAAGSEGLRTW